MEVLFLLVLNCSFEVYDSDTYVPRRRLMPHSYCPVSCLVRSYCQPHREPRSPPFQPWPGCSLTPQALNSCGLCYPSHFSVEYFLAVPWYIGRGIVLYIYFLTVWWCVQGAMIQSTKLPKAQGLLHLGAVYLFTIAPWDYYYYYYVWRFWRSIILVVIRQFHRVRR